MLHHKIIFLNIFQSYFQIDPAPNKIQFVTNQSEKYNYNPNLVLLQRSRGKKVLRVGTVRKLVFHFLSNGMGYGDGDSFPFDFEPNGFPFGSNLKEICHHDHIPFNLKGNRMLVFSL